MKKQQENDKRNVPASCGLDPKKTIIIGDRELDLLAGKNAGIIACYFLQDDNLDTDVADYVVRDIKELKGFIEVID